MRRHALAPLLGSLFLATAAFAASAEDRGFTADDLVKLERVSDPQPSPDGRYVAWVQRQTDMAANRGRTDLWLLDLSRRDAAPQRLTTHEANDQSPRWAPSGDALYFLSARSGTQQVWRLSLGGGEPVQVTRFPAGVDSLRVSPRGDRLAFSARVFRDCADLECTAKRLEAAGKSQASGRTYDQLFVRHWDTWWDGRKNVLFTVALSADGAATGAPVSLSGTLDANVPSTPLGGSEEYDFSPDGSRIAFAARVAGREEAWSTNLDIYEVEAGGGTPRNLTAQNLATDTGPAYSPDGRYLAWKAMARPGFEADRYAIIVLDRQSGRSWELAPAWDRSAKKLVWAADSKSLYAAADEIGQAPLFRVPLVPQGSTPRIERLTGEGTVADVAMGGGRVVYALQSLGSPPQLFTLEGGGSRPASRQLTRAGSAQLAGVTMGAYEQFSFEGANGTTVYGYVMKPWKLEPGKQYPVAFIVHGGPQVSFANNWSFRWNPQVYAGAGYAVVFIDFHGSPGYGQAFTDSISEDWGGKPLTDLKLGLAAAAKKYPWLDAGNACALGASYGGFMINWIAGQWADGFKCLVNHAGLFDHRSMYYTTEELWFTEWENGGPYFQVPENHERWNPAAHVTKWQTPMLVLHGQLDFRVPYTQGLATFTALQRRGIESRLVMFPDENHWVLKPANSLQWHAEVLGWLGKHLQE
ncbi:MAG: S9 family peptidase [Steroidobacteraceae bacterium]|jgi:dipeptidyl aminopeptidase/acylaminoacyl peptidase|nr:S9 family peptidase [Steroidobacteraceae bacterium]